MANYFIAVLGDQSEQVRFFQPCVKSALSLYDVPAEKMVTLFPK